jgi:Uma2 family endonuclease
MIIELLSPSKTYTIKEFLELDLPEEDAPYELIEGEIVPKNQSQKPGPSGKHGEIISRLDYFLQNYAGIGASEPLGDVYSGSACILGQPDGKNWVIPDVAFVLKGRADDFEGPIPVAPDLVIEVNSPSDTTEKIHNKIKAYRNAGVKLIWSIYLLDEFVLIYRQDSPDIKLLNLKDELDGEDVVPGFKLAVAKLFV